MLTHRDRTSRGRAAKIGAVTVLVFLVSMLSGPNAAAFDGAFFHTQSNGNRGADVLAIQHLLNHHGHTAPTDGVFGSTTDSAVRGFQSANGLAVDGIVGPATWAALVPTLNAGASGDAVRALQVELNAKLRINLPIDGVLDPATSGAIRDFQQHAGITVDGVVGPVTWRNLVWHYAYPRIEPNICDQDPDSNGTANWATASAVGQLDEAIERFSATGNGQVPLGDAGFEHGGDIPGHASHEVGMDVDLWPIRTDDAQCTAGRITWESPTYDRAATRQLVREIRAAAPGHLKLIFFNDPVLIEEGLTTEYPNHDNHLHVRYCELVHPDSRYVC